MKVHVYLRISLAANDAMVLEKMEYEKFIERYNTDNRRSEIPNMHLYIDKNVFCALCTAIVA